MLRESSKTYQPPKSLQGIPFIDVTKPQVISGDIQVWVRLDHKDDWKQRYLLAISENCVYYTWSKGYTGEQLNYNVTCIHSYHEISLTDPNADMLEIRNYIKALEDDIVILRERIKNV